MSDWRVIQGDCLSVLPTLDAGSIDAVVTDPPYGLEFMGMEWDRLAADFKESRGNGEWAAAHGTTRKGFDGYSPMPSYTRPGSNIKCPECGNWRDGRDPDKPDRRKGYRCVCGGAQREQARQVAAKMQEWHRRWAEAVLHVLKPGGYMLAFGGSRTHHRLACAVEDAGFEIRDCLMWLYGSGFPKGQGCLKPAYEPILLCRRPGQKVLPLGIDECRVEGNNPSIQRRETARRTGNAPGKPGEYSHCIQNRITPERYMEERPGEQLGRWPANLVLSHHGECQWIEASSTDEQCKKNAVSNSEIVNGSSGACKTENSHTPTSRARKVNTSGEWLCHEDCPVRLLDEQGGLASPRQQRIGKRGGKGFGNFDDTKSAECTGRWPADPGGGVSRFFYCAKASRGDRGEGNTHPTVKPTKLMEWLVKLVTPPGGLCLDPFAGSGSTGKGCLNTGRRFLGIERDPAYVEIATRRLREAENDTPLFATTKP